MGGAHQQTAGVGAARREESGEDGAALVVDRDGRETEVAGLCVTRGLLSAAACDALWAELLALREVHPPVGVKGRLLSGAPSRKGRAPWGHGRVAQGATPAFTPSGLTPRLREAAGLAAARVDGALVDVTVQYYLADGARFGSLSAHVDPPEDGDALAILSLGSECVLHFYRAPCGRPRDPGDAQVRMRPGDLLSLAGEARWRWWHGLATPEPPHPARDVFGAGHVERTGPRVSVVLGFAAG